MTPTHDRQSPAPVSRWERFCERCYAVSMSRVVRELSLEASESYQALLEDLKAPLAPAFEREVARRLDAGDRGGLTPARTLMPEVMARFGLSPESYDDARELAVLARRCNRCPVAGQCWRAARHGTGGEAYRALCPNASAFERQAAAVDRA
ncbi:hypothetical protein [Halomonas ramblicola]|uniref:hypothetical protein n=1 Tax=Halomonas ramblicola TaxID=747349 RepID=UPI0025B4C79F|nr:hypothetical protein [Halomonas ramblicola]MDN3522915.1 hypothetical protein [Halomonas ramblicola]